MKWLMFNPDTNEFELSDSQLFPYSRQGNWQQCSTRDRIIFEAGRESKAAEILEILVRERANRKAGDSK